MNDLNPRVPYRPLNWPDFVLDLPDRLDFDQPAYLVGGAVRDALWGQPIHDLDLTVAQDGIALAKRIANTFDGDFFVLDAERDVGRALIETEWGRITVDVARFRGDDLQADLLDRDFTINAMAVDLSHDLNLLIDPLGGEQDVKARVLRRCNDQAIQHDPIRTLRAVRQSMQFNLRIEPATLTDIKATADGLSRVSAERIRDELIKILAMSKAAGALRVADALQLLKTCLPEVDSLHQTEISGVPPQNAWTHTLAVVESLSSMMAGFSPDRADAPASFSIGVLIMQLDRYRQQLLLHINRLWPNERPHRALLNLAALLHDVGRASSPPDADWQTVSGQIAEKRASELRLSKAEIDRLVVIVQAFGVALTVNVEDDLAVHRFWYRFGPAGIDLCFMALADYAGSSGSEIEQEAWLLRVETVRKLLFNYFERYDEIVAPPAMMDGNQLMRDLDIKPGPIVGILLDHIREAQVTGNVQTIDDALKIARLYLAEINR